MHALLLAAVLMAQDPVDPMKEFEKRFNVESEKLEGKDYHRVRVDDKLLFRDFGGTPKIELVDGGKVLRITQDGKVVLEVQVPDLGKPLNLPPIIAENAVSAKVESKVKNGACEVTVDGKKVYSGPGSKVRSSVSAESSTKDGKKTSRKFVEVYVDDRLVYKAGEGQPDANPKKKDGYYPN